MCAMTVTCINGYTHVTKDVIDDKQHFRGVSSSIYPSSKSLNAVEFINFDKAFTHPV